MPITVRQTPVGALGQLAVMAGQARAQQLQMGRDIQLMSITMAAQAREADVTARRAATEQAFKLQRAAATQIAKQRPVTPDMRTRRQELRRFVSGAETAGIYEPRQIKQARIFADLGDEQAVRSILGKLPEIAKPTARRRELQEQVKAVTEIGKSEISEFQEQLDTITKQLEKRFTPGMQKLLRERPELMATVSPDVQESLVQQQQLEEQISETRERTTGMKQMLQLGLAVPEQMAFEARQEAQTIKQQEAKERLQIQRARGVGGLTEREELAIDLLRDRERDQRTVINREITRLSKDLAPFTDEADDPEAHAERIKPIQAQIRQLSLERMASHGRESKQIAELLKGDKKTLTQVVTDANGQRWRFTGRYRDGKPIYEAIE